MSRYHQILKLAEAARNIFPDRSGLSLANAGKQVLAEVSPDIVVKPHMVGRTATATPSFNSVVSGVAKTADPEDVIAQVIAKGGVPEQFGMTPDYYLDAVRGMRNQLRSGLEQGLANQRVADVLLDIRSPQAPPSVRLTERVAVPVQSRSYVDYPATTAPTISTSNALAINPVKVVNNDPWAGSQSPRIYFNRESRELPYSEDFTNTSATTNIGSLVPTRQTQAVTPVEVAVIEPAAPSRAFIEGFNDAQQRLNPATVVVDSSPSLGQKLQAHAYANKLIDYLKSPVNVGGMGALAAGALFDPDAKQDNRALVGGYQYNTQY